MGTSRAATPLTVKIVVAGGMASPVAALIAAASDLPPLTTTVVTATASGPTRASTTTGWCAATRTVVDVGRTRLTLADDQPLVYLFGVRASRWPPAVWEEVCRAAVGLLILADPEDLPATAAALDYALHHHLPYLIVTWPGDRRPAPADLRDWLALPPFAPLVVCDPTDRFQVHTVLGVLVGHALRFNPPSTTQKGSPCSCEPPTGSAWPPAPSTLPCSSR